MGSAVPDPVVAAAIDGIDADLDVLLADDWVPGDCEEAMVRVRESERLRRRLHAYELDLQDRIGRSGIHKVDGHASEKVMVRHGANLSNAEAQRRHQVVRMKRQMPSVARELAAGWLGVPQAERIGRSFANSRIADQVLAMDEKIARAAVMLPYDEFDRALADWERLADEDGAGDRAEHNHANRDFRMPQNLDGSGRLEGGGGALDTQEIEDVWQRQVRREWEADWAEACARLGDAATAEDLVRTDGQRRFDAMKTCMLRGDLAEYGVEARTCTDLVQDVVTFERYLAKVLGADPDPDPRFASWWDDLLDMGRRARCFTGARQLAVRLSSSSCIWTACQVPSSACQCDHVEAFNGPGQGRTGPGNGAPQGGRHNRLKEQGFTVVRDRRGRWHVFRPDGTEIT